MFEKNLPDLKKLTRWARVALAARTLRRIQSLLLASWPKATKEYQRGVEGAIAEGEEAARLGAVTADLNDAGMAAMEVYGSEPLGQDTANFLCMAASRVSFAGRQPNDTIFAEEALVDALWAVYYFEKARSVKGMRKALLCAIRRDNDQLKATARREKWTKKSPVDPDSLGPLWPEGLPKNWPLVPVARPKLKPKTKRAGKAKLGLPAELVRFLKAGLQLEFDARDTEVGPIRLKPLDHLRIEQIRVRTEGTSLERADPHRNEEGHYLLRAVDLIGEADAYEPEGLLAWFCDYRAFGAWDTDHQSAIVFPEVSWSDIAKHPAHFLDAQWDPGRKRVKDLEAWLHCKFE